MIWMDLDHSNREIRYVHSMKDEIMITMKSYTQRTQYIIIITLYCLLEFFFKDFVSPAIVEVILN